MGFAEPTYFEMFALGATLFSLNNDQKEEDMAKNKTKTDWMAAFVDGMG